jgi:hypothetical protein
MLNLLTAPHFLLLQKLLASGIAHIGQIDVGGASCGRALGRVL